MRQGSLYPFIALSLDGRGTVVSGFIPALFPQRHEKLPEVSTIYLDEIIPFPEGDIITSKFPALNDRWDLFSYNLP